MGRARMEVLEGVCDGVGFKGGGDSRSCIGGVFSSSFRFYFERGCL